VSAVIVTLERNADEARVRGELARRGLWTGAPLRAQDGSVHLPIGEGSVSVAVDELAKVPGIASIATSASAHPLIDGHGPTVRVGAEVVGRRAPVLVAGPCSVESEAQIHRIAGALAKSGVTWLRGGAFKPRTSPYAFQGAGSEALRWMRRAADDNGMKVVTEVLAEGDVEAVGEWADVLQVGSRNMANYALLKQIGRATKPVLLKRAMSATVEEWLLAGEYLLASGAPGVVFCERGIRGFDPSTRNLLDLGAVALLAHAYGLPVIVDPSHATGRRDLILPLARAALAAGAAGVMIETHDAPQDAKSDGPQALLPDQVKELAADLAAARAPSARPGGAS